MDARPALWALAGGQSAAGSAPATTAASNGVVRSEANQSAAATQKAFFPAPSRAASSTAHCPVNIRDRLRTENRVDPRLE
ncbi:hypothetical protein GCM10010478_64350 [Streptomyces erythrogriseus]|uniref:Secreted protein n=1 Tax=Streptomyces erythrogriseus TaxID=284027 RepID=A0ABP6JYL2_9ACTN